MGAVLPADWQALAPIRNPDHKMRVEPMKLCERCGRPFYKWRSSVGRFCTRECAVAFGRERKADELAVMQADPDFLPSIRREMEAALVKLDTITIPGLYDEEAAK